MKSLLKNNKKGFVLPVFAIIVILAVGVILLALFLFNTKVKWTIIGIACLGVVVFLLGKAMTSQSDRIGKEKFAILLVFLAVGLFFIFGSGYIQNLVLPGASYLSVSNVEYDGTGKIIVYTAVGTGSEDLIIDFKPEVLNSYLNKQGVEVTKSLTMNIDYEAQTKSFKLQKNTNEIYWRLYYQEKDSGVLCTYDNCLASAPDSTFIPIYQARCFVGYPCYCVYKYPSATNGLFTGVYADNFKVKFTIGTQTGYITSDRTGHSLTLGDGTYIEWVGDLSNTRGINPPQYTPIFSNSKWDRVVSTNSYSQATSLINSYIKAANEGSPIANALVGQSTNWGCSNTQIKTNVDTYNNIFNTLTVKKDSDYLIGISDLVSNQLLNFVNDELVLDMKVPSKIPTFKIILSADKVGIRPLAGIPSIVSCIPEKTFSSGDTYTTNLQVKNIGTDSGLFNGVITCDKSNIAGVVNSFKVDSGQTVSISASISGQKLTEGTDYSNCNIEIIDLKSQKKASCITKLGVQYQGGIVCSPNSITCISDKIKRTCSADGKTYTDATCDLGCKFVGEVGTCATDNNSNNDLSCRWFESQAVREKKDYGFLYWRFFIGGPNVYPEPYCATADWVIWAIGGVIFGSLGITIYFLYKPKRRKR